MNIYVCAFRDDDGRWDPFRFELPSDRSAKAFVTRFAKKVGYPYIGKRWDIPKTNGANNIEWDKCHESGGIIRLTKIRGVK